MRITAASALCGAAAVITVGCSLTHSTTGCHAYTWPRVVIEMGDAEASSYQYAWRANDGLTGYAGACNGLVTTPAFVCGLAIGGDAAETEMTVFIVREQGDEVLASIDVPLDAFNTEGNGIAVLIASTGDAGAPVLLGPKYVDACQ